MGGRFVDDWKPNVIEEAKKNMMKESDCDDVGELDVKLQLTRQRNAHN
jgi:hypothetical protein